MSVRNHQSIFSIRPMPVCCNSNNPRVVEEVASQWTPGTRIKCPPPSSSSISRNWCEVHLWRRNGVHPSKRRRTRISRKVSRRMYPQPLSWTWLCCAASSSPIGRRRASSGACSIYTIGGIFKLLTKKTDLIAISISDSVTLVRRRPSPWINLASARIPCPYRKSRFHCTRDPAAIVGIVQAVPWLRITLKYPIHRPRWQPV